MTFKFLVIGSNSFSGAQFVNYLLDQDVDVMGVSRSSELNKVYLPYADNLNIHRYQFHQIDINSDLNQMLELIMQFKPEYVVNFAAQGMVAQSWKFPQDWYQTNVVGQVGLHEALRKINHIKKYIHVSTPEVYGSTEGWVSESFIFSPSTPYAVSRAACDMHLMSFFKAYQFPVVFTRAANVYGPGQQLYRIIPRAMLFARLKKKLQLDGGGKSIRSFIHIRDVADATFKIAISGKIGESYHISTRNYLSVKELVERIARLTKVNFEDLAVVSGDRLGKDQAYLLESKKLREEFNWIDKISLDAGLLDTLSWVDKNLETLKKQNLDYIHKP